MKEQTLLCFRLKSKEEVLEAIEKYQHTEIVLVLGTKIERLYFIHNMWKDWKECIIKVIDIDELLEGEIDNMQFDHEIGNPPYQKQVGPDKKITIWDTLVIKFETLLKRGGDYNMIHPGGWRTTTNASANNNFVQVKQMYIRNNVSHIELNDTTKGFKTFGASTDYDIISMIKEPYDGMTKVVTEFDEENLDLRDFNVLPTHNIRLFNKLKATNEDAVEIIFDSSYHTSNGGENCRTRNIKDEIFKYPCVYGLPIQGLKFFYSKTKNRGHFGIPKLILVKASTKSIIDLDGAYGMTQFAYGIIDTPDNLIKIQKVVDSPETQSVIMSFAGLKDKRIVDPNGNTIKFIQEFRKDWWKEFYTDEMEQELIAEGKLNG